MLLFLWLARLRERWFGKLLERTHKRSRSATRQRLYRRLEVERLENRIVPSITLQSEYNGINFGNSGGFSPPDTQGAAGPTNYVETTNQEIAIYSPKSTGTATVGDSLSDFWSTQGGLPQTDAGSKFSDPIVTFDSQVQRFVVGDQDVDFNTHVSNFDIAVSKSASPLTLTSADWNFYQVNTTENGFDADFPGNVGWNHDSLVFTLNMFNTGSGPDHVQVNSININALVNGTPLTEGSNAFQNDFNGFALRPTVMQDSVAGDPMWFVEEGGDNASINAVKMTNVLSNSASFNTTNLAVNPYTTAVPELQPDGTAITSNTDSRIMNAAMENGMLVAAHQVSDATGDLDEIQWYVIDTTGNKPALQQQGDISGGPGTYYSYPGIDINAQGDIGLSYIASGTAAGQFMSMYITGRTPNDAAGAMETPVLVQAGLGNDDNDGRMGDLSGINVDSDGSFWVSNEYATTQFGGTWGTAIGHFTVTTNVTTTANNASATFSPNAQTAPLSAKVVDNDNPFALIAVGVVNFTIKNGSTTVGTAQGTVSNGVADATFNLPKGLAAGKYTIDVSYSDSLGIFTDVADNSATLTITAAKAKTTANNLAASYSPNTQTLALSATVADASNPTDTVNEGNVTFTVKSGSISLGSVTGPVSGGTANANFSLAAGQARGTYSIDVSYSDSLGNFTDNGDTNALLTLSAANVSTTAANVSTAYSPNTQTLALSAIVTDTSVPTDTLNEGVVSFTVYNGSAPLGTVQNSVSGGKASANFNLPGGLPVGNYTITVGYSDSSSNFVDNGDTSGTLAVGAANVVTTASNVSTLFSPKAQTLTLDASVADASIGSDTVNQGVVTFTIKNGSTTVGSASAAVSGGGASTTFALAAGQAAGNYTIAVSYADSLGQFADDGDNSATLTITPAKVTTTANNVTGVFSPNTQTLVLTANLADASIPTDTVDEGTVTFTIASGKTIIGNAQGTVSNGSADADFDWSAGRAVGSYTISVSYTDNQGNFLDSGDTGANLTISPALVTTTANTPTPVFTSSAAQTVALSANVADTSISTDTVDAGTVTFTVKSGGTVLGSVPGTVSGGVANANFNLAAGQAAGDYTVAVSYADSAGNFSDSGNTNATLKVLPSEVTTTASSATASYSPNSQTLVFSANVANTSAPGNAVGEGAVTFTVTSGGTTFGTAQGTVSGGKASASFNVPSGLNAGQYTIGVVYNDSLGNFLDSGNTGATLTITPANVTTTANNVSASYSPNSQTVALSANLADTSIPTDTVDAGTVLFTVKNGSTIIGTATGTVNGGKANASFDLPAQPDLGNDTITVSYSDSNGNFTDSGDTSATFTVIPAHVTTTANSATAVFSPNAQAVTLTAKIADTSISTDTIDRGIVTFTVSSGPTVIGTAQGTVSGGAASASFNLPKGQPAGAYTITVSYSDSTGHFLDSSDTGATLTIAPANATTSANDASVVFSPNAQTVTLTASVPDASNAGDTVGEGAVLFTVKSGSTPVANGTGTVSGGKASASASLPAGLALGNYTIAVSYSDGNGNFLDSGDTGGTLTITPANVTTTAANASTIYSLGGQNLTFSATVATSAGGTVNEGTVTFAVKSGATAVGTAQGTVSGGKASANFNLPAAQAAGNYTLAVSYSDSAGNFIDGGDTGATLTIKPANVTTSVSAVAYTTFSDQAQTLDLSATVANTSNAGDVVNEGVVTFAVLNGSTLLGTAQGTVTGGKANASFTLPAGLAVGNYMVAVTYSDSAGNFTDTSDTSATLTVSTAGTITQLIQAITTPNLAAMTAMETLSAHVGSFFTVSQGTVTQGTVTFATAGQIVSTNVDGNGNATVTLTVPLSTLSSPQSISVSYDSHGNNLASSSDTETAAWGVLNPLAPSSASFGRTGQSVTTDLFGLLISFTSGLLTEIDFGAMHLVFSYNGSNQLVQVAFDGIDLLP